MTPTQHQEAVKALERLERTIAEHRAWGHRHMVADLATIRAALTSPVEAGGRLNPSGDLRSWLQKWAADDADEGARDSIIAPDIDFRERVIRELCSAPIRERSEQ